MAHILVVEDSRTQAEAARMTLEADGHQVQVVNDAEAAWQALVQRRPDLVVSDVVMPGESGFSLCARIRTTEWGRDLPIMLLTSGRDPTDILRALEAGADNFLTRPVEPDILMQRVRTILQHDPVQVRGSALEVACLGRRFTVTSERGQILRVLISAYEDVVRTNLRLESQETQLAQARDRLLEYSAELEERVRQADALEDELRASNSERVQQNHMVQEATRLKSAFLAGMSHELRTPLNSIIGFTELLADGVMGPVPPSFVEYLDDVLQSARHLLRLINDILDLAKVEAGKMEFFPEPVSLAAIVGETVDLLRTQVQRKKLQVVQDVSDDVGQVVTDPARLRQILYNYLSNAVKFTAEQGRVTVRVRTQGADSYRVEVEDTGIGIAPEDLPRLFSEFQQIGPHDAAHRQEGTGLGLALTRRLVEAQGGHVEVQSTPGQGSTFAAVMPRQSGVPSSPVAEPVLSGAKAAEQPGGLAGLRVLIVDDDPLSLKLLELLLRRAGCQVRTAGTAVDMLTLLQQFEPQAMLLDLEFPEANGPELLQLIRRTPRLQRALVAAVSAKAMKGDRERALAAGFDAWFAKPIDPRTFVRAFAEVLQRQSASQGLGEERARGG